MLRIRDDIANRIRMEGAEAYPHECCGALLGHERDGRRDVADIMSLTNQRDDSPRNRFLITPEDVRASEIAARRSGLEVLGWYHSHPDAAAKPSEFDREHAWPWYSYVIVSVQSHVPKEMNSWRLAADRASYHAEAIEIESHGHAD